MFSRRRSMNVSPPRLSTASGVDRPLVPQDAPPLPPGLHSPSSASFSQSQRADPYKHHLQQSESKVRPVSGSMKYPQPIENKAQTPKRPKTSSHILDRVSSLFNSPSGKQNAASTDRTTEDEMEGRDGSSNRPSSGMNKLSKLIKPTSRNPPKKKRAPPPIITTASTSTLSTSSFLPFRSLTYSRSKLAQQMLGTLAENSPVERARTPRTPRSFWYNGESDEDDIRRPSGLGHRASTSSLPSSPYGGRYPWEVGPELDQEQPPEETINEGASSKEKGDLKETFRFPNRSLNNVISEDDADQRSVGGANIMRTGRRPRALSSPTPSSHTLKAKEKQEKELELQRLTTRPSKVSQLSEIPIPKEQRGQVTSRQEPQDDRSAEQVEGIEGEVIKPPYDEREFAKEVDPDRSGLGMVKNGPMKGEQTNSAAEGVDGTAQQDGAHHLSVNQLHQVEHDTGRERERIMSFSLVRMFPEPPSTRPSSDLPPMSSSSTPIAAPASSAPSVSSLASKRFSTATMASVMTTTSTATMTSLGANFSIINGPYSLSAFSFPDSPTMHRSNLSNALPNGDSYLPSAGSLLPLPSLTSPFTAVNPSTPATTTATLTFHSFPPSPYPFSLQLPYDVLGLALSYLPDRRDLASVARVNKECAAAVRVLLYSTIHLTSLEQGVEDGPIRVRKLLRLLVKRNDLTALVTKFVCHEWPEWFPSSPYLPQHDLETPLNACCEELEELENTFLSATLVLALSRMTGLREIVVPSYHPFLFASTKEMTWSGLRSAEFKNVTLDDEEAKETFAWLEGMNGLERLSFPMLVEKSSSAKRASNDSIKPVQQTPKSPKRLSTQRRCSSCLSPVPWSVKAGNLTDSTGISTTHMSMSFPICNSGCAGVQVPETQSHDELGLNKPGPEWVHPLAKFASSRMFLPNLKVLHATPTIVSLLAASSPEQPQLEGDDVDKLSRPLVDVTVNIDMTLYTGLRPTALVQGLYGLRKLGLRFGERVDRRTVEKMLMSVGTGLGGGLAELQIELIGAWTAGSDETLYKILDASLPRYPVLRRLKLHYSKEDDERSSSPLTVMEETRLGQWVKNCSQLEWVELLSGSSWRRLVMMSTV